VNLLLTWLADLYSPLLVGATLLLAKTRSRSQPAPFWHATILGLAIVYSLMLLDQLWHLWPHWGMDYSTHTGFALIWARALARLYAPVPVYASLLAYAGLMAYMGYHSWADMLSSALAILLLQACLTQAWRQFQRRRSGPVATPPHP
jgi:uncharacterized membrane protein (UPF0136 family)